MGMVVPKDERTCICETLISEGEENYIMHLRVSLMK
jgi:hypothetical protein